MAFEDEVRRIAQDISQRMSMLGEDGPSPDFWSLVGSRLDEEAQALGVDRLALLIAVQAALADSQDAGEPVQAMSDLLASLRAQTEGRPVSMDELEIVAQSILSATVSYVVKEAYKGASLSFWHVLITRLRAQATRHQYPGASLLEALMATVRMQTGIDPERRPNEAAVILCRVQLQRDFTEWAGRAGALRLVIYPDGSVTYRTVSDAVFEPSTSSTLGVLVEDVDDEDDDEDNETDAE